MLIIGRQSLKIFNKRLLITRSFCAKKSPQQQSLTKTKQSSIGQQQNIKHELKQVAIANQQEDKRKTKELRDAILFEEILKNEVKILIYDTQQKNSLRTRLFTILILSLLSLSYFEYLRMVRDPKQKLIMEKTEFGKTYRTIHATIVVGLSILVLRDYRRFYTKHVEKIIFDSKTNMFDLYMRNFFGFQRIESVHRYKLVYTEDPKLWKKKVNYYHIDTLKGYQIGKAYAWKRQDLFAHLISQRIKLNIL